MRLVTLVEGTEGEGKRDGAVPFGCGRGMDPASLSPIFTPERVSGERRLSLARTHARAPARAGGELRRGAPVRGGRTGEHRRGAAGVGGRRE